MGTPGIYHPEDRTVLEVKASSRADVLTSFVEEAPGHDAALRAATGLGAGSLARACLDAEHGAREGRLPAAAELGALRAELDATCRAFAAVAAQLTAGGPARVG